MLSTKRFSLSFGTAYYKKFQTQKDFHELHARFASGNITSEYSNLIIPQFLLDIFGYMKDQNQVSVGENSSIITMCFTPVIVKYFLCTRGIFSFLF